MVDSFLRARLTLSLQMAYFDGPQWNDATTAAWLAGVIERAGSVAVRPRSGVVLLTVSARERTTVEAAHALFPAGRVAAHPKIAGIYVWSVQGASEVRQIPRGGPHSGADRRDGRDDTFDGRERDRGLASRQRPHVEIAIEIP
jgi:hypothetical protein